GWQRPETGRTRVGRHRSACDRPFIFQEFHTEWTHLGRETGYTCTSSWQAVEMFLFHAHSDRATRHSKTEQISVERDAVLRASHGHRRMIDTQEKILSHLLHTGLPLPSGNQSNSRLCPSGSRNLSA